ncbi:MAG: V-type ATP synthase subunit E family protein [Candidatus Sedimenticola sp. 20ELBAFRAG]
MADQVQELESAILQQAKRLAAEYQERAKRSRDNILREAHDRLHLREEREVLVAKAKSERIYRRKVQASELKFQNELDHLRWDLVEGILEQLADNMNEMRKNQEEYRQLLSELLANAAQNLDTPVLVADVNSDDLKQLTPVWDEFVKNAVPDREISLNPVPIETLGGILLRSEDNRVRINNTFEGRLERLASQLHQIIIQRLLPDRRAHERVSKTI